MDVEFSLYLRGDYTLLLPNFVLDITFKRIYQSKEKYTFLEREFYKEHIGNVNFGPKITIFEKITKNVFFATFCSK